MKTLVKTLFTAALTALLCTSSMVATFAAEPAKAETITASLSKFNRIWLSGNVKIVLTQGYKQNVEGESNYDAAKISISTDVKTYLSSH